MTCAIVKIYCGIIATISTILKQINLGSLTEKFESDKNTRDLICKLSVHDMETLIVNSPLNFTKKNGCLVSELLVVSGDRMTAHFKH